MHNILRRHLVVQNKYHRHKALNDRRVAVALQFDNAVGVSPHHDPHGSDSHESYFADYDPADLTPAVRCPNSIIYKYFSSQLAQRVKLRSSFLYPVAQP